MHIERNNAVQRDHGIKNTNLCMQQKVGDFVAKRFIVGHIYLCDCLSNVKVEVFEQ